MKMEIFTIRRKKEKYILELKDKKKQLKIAFIYNSKKVITYKDIEEKINYVLYSEINPGLAAHGGEVSLVEVLDGETAILQFGGGCQGCGMVDLTLKDGVEKTLLEQVEGLKRVQDVTDHSFRENAYYK